MRNLITLLLVATIAASLIHPKHASRITFTGTATTTTTTTSYQQSEGSTLAWYPLVIQAVVERLSQELPLDAPVIVGVMDIPNAWGLSWYSEAQECYMIALNRDVKTPDFLLDTLMHEWAHCLTNGVDLQEGSDHGASWGVAYAACYRAVVEGPL